MNIKNALLICARNFVLIWKQMVYTLILAVIVGLCLWRTLTPVFEMLSNEGWFKLLAEYLESIYTKPSDMAMGFELIMTKLWVLFVDNTPLLWGNYVISILLIVLVPNVALSVATFTAGDVVNAKLCSNVNYGWLHRLLSSAKHSIPYALVDTLIKLPFLALYVCAFILYGTLASSWILATLLLPALILVVLALSSLRHTLTMWFLPECVVVGGNVFKCLGRNCKLVFKNFSKLALSTFMLYLVEFAGVMLLTVFTLGAGLILLIPAIPVINVAYSLIYYYQANSMRYYLDANTIVNPVQD